MSAVVTSKVTLDELRAKHRVTEEAKERQWALVRAAEARAGALRPALSGLDRTALLNARVELPRVEQAHDEALLAAAAADAAEASAREAIRAAVRADSRVKKLVALTALEKAAQVFRVENEKLRAIEIEEHELTGGFVDFFAWTDFAPSSADGTFRSRIDEWLDRVETYRANK